MCPVRFQRVDSAKSGTHTSSIFIIDKNALWTGEWWDANVVDVENAALLTGGGPNVSDAYTINGKAGDLYPCNTKRKLAHVSAL